VNRKREKGSEKDGGMGGEGKKGDFQKFEILTASTPLQCQLAPPCQISCMSVKPFHTYDRLLNFSRWRLSTILDFQKFVILTARTLGGSKMLRHAKFCADGSNRCRDMAVFDFSRWRPFAILDFKKFKIVTAHALRRAKMHHRA